MSLSFFQAKYWIFLYHLASKSLKVLEILKTMLGAKEEKNHSIVEQLRIAHKK